MIPVKSPTQGQLAESVYIEGDLSKLTEEQRVAYYMRVCDSLGLNPATRPFQYITLNGKLTLYATRAATDQLRKVNSVSLEIVSRDIHDGILTVHVRASLPDGRRDEDLGTVPLPDTLKGDARANAELKAITKAKRRATLSICGLGWLDETEVETIPGARKPPQPAPNAMLPAPVPHDPNTGEIQSAAIPAAAAAPVDPVSPPTGAAPLEPTGAAPPLDSQQVKTWDDKLAEAALQGLDALRDQWADIPAPEKKVLRAALDRRHKPTANRVDQEHVAKGWPEDDRPF